jgi:hypothetical protein
MQRRASAATYMYTKRKKRLAGGFNELHEKKFQWPSSWCAKEKLNYYCTWGLLFNESGSVVEET